MYIAGLNIPVNLTHNQGVEAIVVLSTLATIVQVSRQQSVVAAKAISEGGPVKTLPTSFISRIVSPMHSLAIASTPLAYLLGVTLNGLRQPGWMAQFNFPIEVDAAVGVGGVGGKAWLRTAACLGLYGCGKFMQWTLNHLGAQWHFIGRREKPQLISTGPYAYVRHPMYSILLAQQLAFAGMFWSYAPLAAFGVIAAAFAIKIPIEEKLIEDDPIIGSAYTQYKKKVTARIIPHIW